MKSWTKPFIHRSQFYEATFLKRPHREGLEVAVTVEGTTVKISDAVSGERQLIEKVKGEIDKVRDNGDGPRAA